MNIKSTLEASRFIVSLLLYAFAAAVSVASGWVGALEC